MGWFWADTTPAAPTAPHPMPRGNAEPPPSCPMHKKGSTPFSAPKETATTPKGACPYVPPSTSAPTSDASSPAPKQGLLSRLNPLNNMPFELSNAQAENQTQSLPLSREASTIPKGDGSLWEYPSPQQMYNAMLRKGYTDTPADAVESMVSIHNFLNEGAWAEIMGWEKRFAKGLVEGWRVCKRGEENANMAISQDGGEDDEGGFNTSWNDTTIEPPKLLRFTGRPDEPTPKSQIFQFLSWAWPAQFSSPPPFDRHDWTVQRNSPDGTSKEIRYVIDYYEGEDGGDGEPVFFLDVRPAVDGPRAVGERVVRWGTDVWWRASGGTVREVRKAMAERKRLEEKERGW